MALGSLFDPNLPTGPASDYTGPRPFLSRAQLIGLRALLVVYVLTLALLTATNFRPVGNAVFRLSAMHLAVRLTIGLMGAATGVTFLLLMGMSLHHFFRGHAGARPAGWWLWILVLLNFAGVVVYYLYVIEPEQRALIHIERAT